MNIHSTKINCGGSLSYYLQAIVRLRDLLGIQLKPVLESPYASYANGFVCLLDVGGARSVVCVSLAENENHKLCRHLPLLSWYFSGNFCVYFSSDGRGPFLPSLFLVLKLLLGQNNFRQTHTPRYLSPFQLQLLLGFVEGGCSLASPSNPIPC